MEVVQVKRRGGELCRQLSSGQQINGSVVAAPPAAKSAVSDEISRLVEAFSQLEENVLEIRKDLIESISLHDLLQDIHDLEVGCLLPLYLHSVEIVCQKCLPDN